MWRISRLNVLSTYLNHSIIPLTECTGKEMHIVVVVKVFFYKVFQILFEMFSENT